MMFATMWQTSTELQPRNGAGRPSDNGTIVVKAISWEYLLVFLQFDVNSMQPSDGCSAVCYLLNHLENAR